MKNLLLVSLAIVCFVCCKNTKEETATSPREENWIQLFNGKNLDGWTVKIRGYEAGNNFGNTFRVEDGVLKVAYDAYNDTFNNRFGHIYTNQEYSHYKLRVEYRFVGEQLSDGAGWAYRNSGAMLHAQAPETVHLDQDFPASIEAQFLGGNGTDDRPTGNVCTPGTDIFIGGVPYGQHCANSTSKTYPGDQWVSMEMIILGDSIGHHIVDGDTVMTYTKMTVDGKGLNPEANVTPGPLKSGRIALQSESHPVEFRKVELLDLSKRE
ncbi:MAG: DUF1080 domain-containing protein [Dysgonamonadaceae bacterium]|jgi:hypothetical protein|nr:DUF1080 domain-containing protein [Dysgonamonadaceae bacterium]